MDPTHSKDRRAGPRRLSAAARRLLLLPVVPTTGGFVRPIEIVAWPILIVAALFVCIPILIVTILAAVVVAALLAALGVPGAILAAVLLVGFGGGLVLSFVALLRISRRLPSSIRALRPMRKSFAAQSPNVCGRFEASSR